MGEKLEEPEKDIIGSYLANIRGTVPIAIEEIDAILRLIAAARDPIRSFLDLSCDGGTLAAAILGEYPQVTGVLIEDSTPRPWAVPRRNWVPTAKPPPAARKPPASASEPLESASISKPLATPARLGA